VRWMSRAITSGVAFIPYFRFDFALLQAHLYQLAGRHGQLSTLVHISVPGHLSLLLLPLNFEHGSARFGSASERDLA
jgi:hypothetical protein